MKLEVFVRGKPETIYMLQATLAPRNPNAFAQEEGGAWLEFNLRSPKEISPFIDDLRDLLDLAAGAMSLWANCQDRPKLTNIRYVDRESGKQRGMLFNAYSTVAPPAPENLVEPTPSGLPRGAAVIESAQDHAAVARALSVSAAGASEWWELYILLEILRDSVAGREDRRSGSWQGLFGFLSQRYGEPVKRLRALRQTINYHRHFHSELPATPWEHRDAMQFVRTAVRDWIDELLVPELDRSGAEPAAAPDV